MSLLTIIQNFARRTNIAIPATVMGDQSAQVRQVLALLEEEGAELSGRGDWEALTFEAAHTSIANEDQGAVATIASNNFRYIKNETFWDRTDQLPVLGPINDKEWQSLKAVTNTGPRYYYRIRGGKLLLNPTPTAGHNFRFEYVSWNWILGADLTTYKQYFTLDTDTVLLPEPIVMQGLRWRWKREKGFEYAEDFRSYEMMVNQALSRDGGKPTLDMAGSHKSPSPGVFIPAGSWSVP